MNQATPTQRAVIESRGCELAVAAGAGSGKTSTLIKRIIGLVTGLIGDGSRDAGQAVDLTSLLVVTFTRAAAAELRERVDQALEEELAAQESELPSLPLDQRSPKQELIRHLRRQRLMLPVAQISTIHSYCQHIINQYGAADGLSAENLLSDEDAAQLKHQLATRFLDRQLSRTDDPTLRALALAWGGRDGVGPSRVASDQGDSGLRALVLKLHGFQQSLLDPVQWWAQQAGSAQLDPERFEPDHTAIAGLLDGFVDWRDEALQACKREAEALAGAHPGAIHLSYLAYRRVLLGKVQVGEKWDEPVAALKALTEKCDGKEGRPELPHRQQAVSAYRRDLDKTSRWYESVATASIRLKSELNEWLSVFCERWPDVARRENVVNEWLERLWKLGLDFNEVYSEQKRRRQVMDFNDLERGALSLLLAGVEASKPEESCGVSARLIPSQLAMELRGTYSEVLVDEYQDVNRLQDAILQLVTPELPGGGQARVVVGDIKQSIYGFRQADSEIFRELVARLDTVDRPGQAGTTYRLRTNFRSHSEILNAVNALMDGVFTEHLGGEDYSRSGSLEYGGSYGAKSDASQEPGRVRLHLVLDSVNGSTGAPVGEGSQLEDGEGSDGSAPGTDEKVYHHLARRLRQVFQDGQQADGYLTERGGVKRPVQWEDLVVLLRSRKSLGILRIILEQAGVPAQVPSSGSFFEQPDVVDALMLLRATVNPYDDLALASVLRGPLGQLSNEQLLITLHGGKEPPGKHAPVLAQLQAFLDRPSPDLPYTEDVLESLQDRLAMLLASLDSWRNLAVREPVSAIVWRVMDEVSLFVSARAAPYGAQRVANLYELHDRALEFDALGRYGLARFLEHLDAVQASAQDAGEFPAATGAGAVRIMTVHQAKGLEFPCVFIPYLHRKFNQQDLRQQVLFSSNYGLAGQHLDLLGPLETLPPGTLPELPERKPTLGFRCVKHALEQQLTAEELRLLYVAMTRAQERLEMFAVLNQSDSEAERNGPPAKPEQAKRPWDWVRAQLAEGVVSALNKDIGVELPTVGSWVINTVAAPATAEEGEVERQGWDKLRTDTKRPYRLDAEDLMRLKTRLKYTYPWSGSAQLPVKATITGLAKPAQPQGVRPDPFQSYIAENRSLALIQPGFLTGQHQSSPFQHGSDVHRMLSMLDVTRQLSECELRDYWLASGSVEFVQEYSASVARMLCDLQAAFGPWKGMARAHELPVTMRVPAHDLGGLLATGSIELKSYAADDWVLVQGVLDLLLLWPDHAVVLDYKTDRRLDRDGLISHYGEQLGLYASAVTELWPHLQPGSITTAIYALNGPGLVIL